jgi:hypothetical protein
LQEQQQQQGGKGGATPEEREPANETHQRIVHVLNTRNMVSASQLDYCKQADIWLPNNNPGLAVATTSCQSKMCVVVLSLRLLTQHPAAQHAYASLLLMRLRLHRPAQQQVVHHTPVVSTRRLGL